MEVKMNTLKKAGTTLLLLILALASPYMSQPVQAQQSTLQPSFPISVPQPPEVSRLAGMINYPVSHNTGLIQTEIPLYEIRLRNGFTLPVKLVYRSSGFKPHERSVTGVGWSLTAEPQIAHAVNGLPDELPYNGLYGSENGLRVSDKGKQIDALYGRYDIAPDQYFYLLPRKSGSFFLNRPASNLDSKTFVTLPYDPLRIEPSDGLETFTLTDTDGMRYVFTPMEETETITEDLHTSAFSVYKAAQITAPNNETITFSYKGLSDNTPYEYILHSYEQRATLEIKKQRLPTTAWIDYCDGQENVYDMDEFTPNFIQQRVKLVQTDITLQGTSDPENMTTVYYVDEAAGQGDSPLRQMCDGRRGTTYWTQTITARHLQKITFPGGSVELAYTETGTLNKVRKYLSGIVVKDMDGRTIKQFQLYYTFFGDHPRLDALVETSKDGLHHRTYAFSYWNVAGASYDTHRVNAWGYYTTVNTDENQTLIPKLAGTFHLYEDNGNMSDSFLFRYGKDDYYRTPSSGIGYLPFMLKSVTYPTGGRTEFHYEQNRFWEESRGKAVTDGSLRIKEILHYRPDGQLASKRRFAYGQDESGLGLPVHVLQDEDFMTSYHQQVYRTGRPDLIVPGWYEAYPIYKVELHARPVVNTQLGAASIVYDRVTEYFDDNGEEGKTVYEYDYADLDEIRSTRFGLGGNNPTLTGNVHNLYGEWRVGQLLRKTDYDGTGKIVREELNSYKTVPGIPISCMQIYTPLSRFYHDPYVTNWETLRVLKVGDRAPNSSGGATIPKAPVPEESPMSGMDFRNGYKILQSTRTTDWRDNRSYSRTSGYEYNDNLLPVKLTHRLENGQTETELRSYPDDFTDEASQAMTGMNWIEPVIRSQWSLGTSARDEYTPYRLEGTLPVPDRVETGKDNGTRETRMEFTRYDTWGNLLQAVKDGTQYQSYLWSYGSLYPVALLEHEPLTDAEWKNKVSTTATDSALIASACSTLRSQLRGKALVSSYTYRPLEGLSSMTDPQGRKTSFAYNRFGELCRETDTDGAKVGEYTYHYGSDGAGGTLRFSISCPATCEVNKILTFTATVTAGSGDCQYQWTLRQGSAIIGKQDLSSAGSFSHSFSQTGDYILTCRVTDGSGMTAVKSTAVKVEAPTVDPTVSFYYVNQSTQGTLYALEAEFMCPFQTEMTFALTYSAKNFTPATYYITGSDNKEYKFTRTGEGSDLVTVSLPAGKVRIYVTYDQRDERCYLDILSGTGGILLKYPTHLDINTRID